MRRLMLLTSCLFLFSCAATNTGEILSRWPTNEPLPTSHLTKAQAAEYAQISRQVQSDQRSEMRRRAAMSFYQNYLLPTFDFNYGYPGYYNPWRGFGWNFGW